MSQVVGVSCEKVELTQKEASLDVVLLDTVRREEEGLGFAAFWENVDNETAKASAVIENEKEEVRVVHPRGPDGRIDYLHTVYENPIKLGPRRI